jgi:hypothetical protein
MKKRQTAGELSLKARSDSHVYDPLELGYALTDDVMPNIIECALRHHQIFDEPEYFVCLFVASDPLIKGVRRHKYAAFLYLPSPRPEQMCFLYNKITGKLKRLWSLPNAAQMAMISETPFVEKKWRSTKAWSDAFFKGEFWELIRKENNFSHLSEIEFLKANREKLIKSGAKECPSDFSQPFDFSKVAINHIEDTKTARAN